MYSSKKSVQQLASLLRSHMITQIVISPGARNMPIAQTLINIRDFECHAVLDERGAGYFAIGLSLSKECTVALCCTSGTAALNYAPAVAEAYYQRRPIVIITADRPECWLGQLENQTIPQRDLFGKLVKMSVTLPEVRTEEDEWYCNRLINEALIELDRRLPGPVHINVPLSEPLFEMIDDVLPAARIIRRLGLEDFEPPFDDDKNLYAREYGRYFSHMLILGQGDYTASSLSEEEILAKLDKIGCIVLAEHTAIGIEAPTVIKNFDAVIASMPEREWSDLSAELVITVGNMITSKRLKQLLRKHKPWQHWHLSVLGEIVDPFQSLTDVIEVRADEFMEQIIEIAKIDKFPRTELAKRWHWAAAKLPVPEPGYSDFMAVGEFMKNLPCCSRIFLGNSMSVRLAHLFIPEGTRQYFYANRGVSGIDGNLSTAMGIAVGDTLEDYRQIYVILGDLAFYYDMNAAISTGFSKKNLRILINNNGGGEIFRTLPGFQSSEATDKHITLQRKSSARDWALERDFVYLAATNEEELHKYMTIFMDMDVKSSIVLEVFTDMDQNIRELNNYYDLIRRVE